MAANDIVDEVRQSSQLTTDKALQTITLGEFWELYKLDRATELRGSTLRTYECAFRRLGNLADVQVRELTPILLTRQINGIKAAPRTINLSISLIKLICKHAKYYNIIADNPAEELTSRKTDRPRLHILSQDTLDSFFEAIKGKVHEPAYVKLAIARYTGMRYGEIVGLTWSDIDCKQGFVDVHRQWGRISETEAGFTKPKSKNGIRRIPIPTALIAILQEYRQRPTHISGRLFSDKWAESNSVNYILRRYLPGTSVHDFRHTYATRLLAEGMDVKTVAILLGDSVSTIINVYLHYSDEMEAKAKKTIERMFA